jgi:membrane associated rhomboid family serine protease
LILAETNSRQIAIFVLMVKKYGFASQTENPLYGPSAAVLVKYGAKQGGYIIYKRQRWRLVSPIFLHAGVIHLAANVYIQVPPSSPTLLIHPLPSTAWGPISTTCSGQSSGC